MKTKLQIAFLILAIALPSMVSAQFVLSGELRPRAEYRHGFKSPATTDMDAAAFISQRSRLNVAYKNEKMKFGLSLQDVRVWGDVPQLNLSDNSFSMHEAWGEYFFTPALSLKLGRQELVYDDSRILGNVDWAQQGRSHDMALLKFEQSAWKAHLGFAYNQDRENLRGQVYTLPGNYKSLLLAWANRKWDNLSISVLFLNNGMQGSYMIEGVEEHKTHFTQTFGGTATYQLMPLTFNASIYKTLGEFNRYFDMDALNYSANAMWAINGAYSISAGYEYLSGTSEPITVPRHSFNPLYGTNHKFNGHMDYYYVGNHLYSVGLNDLFLKVNYNGNKFNAGADLHFFGAAADVVDRTNYVENMSRNLGQELDLYLGYKLTPGVTFNMGYSQYFTTETTVAIKGGSTEATSNWFWASFTFKPEFLRYSEK